MGLSRQRPLQPVEAGQDHAGRRAERVLEERGRPARNDRDAPEGHGELPHELGHPRQRGGGTGVGHHGGQGAVEVEEEGAARRVGRQRRQQVRQGHCGAGRRGQRQVVVVVVVARSEPMTTTTSTPVTPVTGMDVVCGSTWAGLTPMDVAIAPACCCWPAA